MGLEETGLAPGKDALIISTLGTFQMELDQVVIPHRTIHQNKTWELFLFLLTNRGRTLSTGNILEALWPDADYTDLRAALRMQLYRIRRILNNSLPGWEEYISLKTSQGTCRLDIGENCRLDVEQFGILCREALQAAPSDLAALEGPCNRAISLYHGEYLTEMTSNIWVLPQRNYYRNNYLKIVFKLMDALRKHRMFKEAIELCEKVFLIEPLDEDLHICYLEVLLDNDKKQKALAHYKNIISIMYHDVGLKPSAAMNNIYRSLMSGGEAVDPFAANGDAVSLNVAKELLSEYKEVKGALFCKPDTFRFICSLEKRRGERSGLSVLIGLLTLVASASDYSLPPPAKLDDRMEALRRIITTKLRRGDVASRWNEAQFILLLTGVSLDQAESVLQRVKGSFKEHCGEDSEVHLLSTLQPLCPWL